MVDAISKFLGTSTDIVATVEPSKKLSAVTKKTPSVSKKEKLLQDNLETDYEYARDNIRRVIDENMAIVSELTSMAIQAQDPAWFEAAGKFMKQVVEANDKLMQLSERQLKPIQQHENKKELAVIANEKVNEVGQNGQSGQTSITNNTVFLGTTEELFNNIMNTHNRQMSKVIN